MYSGPDKNQATIPATTFKAMFTDAKIRATWSTSPERRAWRDQAKAEIYRVLGAQVPLRSRRHARAGVWDTRENQRITGNIALGIQIFLGIIGALTLLVGGMGVANIMYAVVKERTREIGVKMALGAKVRQVMAPFVMEALMMTVMGGRILGTVVSLGLMAVIAALPLEGRGLRVPGPPTFSPAIAVATSVVLGTIGMLAGYFPARRAAIGQPRGARYEVRVDDPDAAASARSTATGASEVEALRGVDLEIGGQRATSRWSVLPAPASRRS